MMKRWMTWAPVLLICLLAHLPPVAGQTPPATPKNADTDDALLLSRAVICETLDAFNPLNPSAVYSVDTGSVMCFTAFDVVPRETSIFHDWIRRDKLIFRKKLVLKPPRWSSVSSIQLREADKGVWRVEVREENGPLLHVLRFSITD